MKKLLLIISLISITLCGNEIRKMVNQIASQIGEMKRRLEKAPVGPKSKFRPVVSRGYEYYAHTLVTIYNPAIMEDCFDDYLRDIVPAYIQGADATQKEKIKKLISLSEFSAFNKILVPKVLFKKGSSSNNMGFLAIMSEKNTDTIDFLFLIMSSNFKLADEYYVAVKSNRVLFWGSSAEYLIAKPRALTEDDLEYLFNFLQICMFSRAQVILNALNRG